MNYGQFTYGSAIKYLLGTISRIPVLFRGFKYIPSGFSDAGRRMSDSGTSINMSNAALNELYDALGAILYLNLFSDVIHVILNCVVSGIITGLVSVVLYAVSIGVMLLLYALVVWLMESKKDRWNLTLIKVLIVLGFISVAMQAISLIFALIGVITSFGSVAFGLKYALNKIVPAVLNLILGIALILLDLIMLSVFGRGEVMNMPNQNGYGAYGYGANGYGNNGFNNAPYDSRGLDGLGAVNQGQPGQSIQQPIQPVQQVADLSKQGQSIQAQQVTQPTQPTQTQQVSQPTQPPLTEQMFSCPYCNKPIHLKESPCHHCGQQIQW